MSDVRLTFDNAAQSSSDEVLGEISQEFGSDTQEEDTELKQERNRRLRIENDTLEENKEVRRFLINSLTCLSFAWLIFTAIIVLCLGIGGSSFRLSDAVSVTFITTSLATVCGLWVIGLKYFFSPN